MVSILKKFLPLILIIVVLTGSFFQLQYLSNSQTMDKNNEEIVKGEILSELKSENTMFDNREYLSQTLQVEVTSGSIKGRIITVETALIPKFNQTKYNAGEKILMGYMKGEISNENFYIISYDRSVPLTVLVALFIVISLGIARKNGLFSLLGMALSVLILTVFVLPAIVDGANPLLTSIVGMISMVPILFYVSHGVNKKTSAAIMGTVLTLTITAIFAFIFVGTMHLTGLTFDEVETLLYLKEGNFDLQGVLLAGILMSVLGVIDDVAMTQASVVEELYSDDKKIKKSKMFGKAMNVGRDHIASVINTLILVYVGGSLTTLLLFTEFPRPLQVLLNSEVVLIPIVISLIGSIGLILAIPITTLLAVLLISRKNKELSV